MSLHKEFFVNGHHCKVEATGHRHWTAYLDGEEFGNGHEIPHQLKADMYDNAKWMVETDIDTEAAVRATYEYIESKDPQWVTQKAVEEDVLLDGFPIVSEILFAMVDEDLLEEAKVYDGKMNMRMYRVIDDA